LHAVLSGAIGVGVSQPEGREGCACGHADGGAVWPYPRYGYRRIRIFIDCEGHRMSSGRAHRLWQAARLQVPRKRPRKPHRRCAAATPTKVWCYDFVSDHCANGQQLKCLTVADEFTKQGLAIKVDGRIRSARVIEVLSRLVSARRPEVSAQRQRAQVRV
jgi:hypothetical protein